MRAWLFWCCLLCPLAWGDGHEAQRLSELGSRSRLLCVHALAYFDPQARDPDPHSLTSLFYQLNAIDMLVMQFDRPEALQRPLAAMQALFKTLDGLPRDQAQRYPELVRQLLEQSGSCSWPPRTSPPCCPRRSRRRRRTSAR